MIELRTEDFFVVGGALSPDAPSYITRRADEELLRMVLSGQYCNVLTARQMGKTSLMVRTVNRLHGQGICSVVIDLASIGTTVSASEWYLGLASRFKRQLELTVDEHAWWAEHALLGPVQRFSDFLRHVVLEELQEHVAVFIDEIDSTLNLPFADNFFAAVRAAYNARAVDAVYNRLTFVLFGVARPSDLIKARTRTPYNIGTLIDLRDFTSDEAKTLLPGLAAVCPEQAEAVLQRVLYWSDGHPYLTQRICAEIVSTDGSSADNHWNDQRVDAVVSRLFLAEDARKETNLQFIRDRIRASRQRAGMLRVYRRVRAGQRVVDEERSVAKSQLKLTGLVKSTPRGELVVRNRIYTQVFDLAWVKENMPVSRSQRLAIAATLMAVLTVLVAGYLIYTEQTRPDSVRAELFTGNFTSATSPEVRISNLAGLFKLPGYEDEARDLFFSLDPSEQLAMFASLQNPRQVGQDLFVVVAGVYKDRRLANTPQANQLLRAMARRLHEVEEGVPGARALASEIDFWVDGREFTLQGNLTEAIERYGLALGLNDENQSIYFDRAVTYAKLKEYGECMKDFDQVLQREPERLSEIEQLIRSDSEFNGYLGLNSVDNADLATRFPTWTPTFTPTPTPTPTFTPTPTPTPTHTPTPTRTFTPTRTRTITPTSNVTSIPTSGGSGSPGPQPPPPPQPTDTPAPPPTDTPASPPTREPTPTLP